MAEDTESLRAWTYLLLSEWGEVYLGATTQLRQRIRKHNSPESTQWTRGRRWHLLAARGFANRKAAFDLELELKKRPDKKKKWKVQCIACKQNHVPPRLRILAKELAHKVDRGQSTMVHCGEITFVLG